MRKQFFIISLLAVFILPLAMNAQEKDMWDFVKQFRTTTGRQQNVASDGEFIYTSTYSKAPNNNPPVNSQFYKYDFDGNLIEEFDIPGCDHLRDLTYDGQYFYGGSAADGHESRLYCVDLVNKTLIGYVDTPLESIRNCSYDPVNDGFYVGTSTSLIRIDRSGQQQASFSGVPASGLYCNGSGYYTDTIGQAHLLMFCNQGITPYVYDYNITTNSFNNTPVLDYTTTPGYVIYGGAGGAFVGEYNGNICFYGDSPSSPNHIGIYSLETGETPEPPTPPTPPEGDVFYDFEDALNEWTAIDADGDGYNWELNRNWGNADNLYSMISRSRDELLGQPLYPDNYLVCPWKLNYDYLIFDACAKDANYPNEHIGVAVSTTDAVEEDFIDVWEATLTPHKLEGDWITYEVDLREYHGEEIWVAIRHFFSTDQFAVVVDNISLIREYNDDNVGETAASTVEVYPVPASDMLNVTGSESVDSYEIYNMAGALVRRGVAGSNTFTIDVRDLPAGSYFLRMNSENVVRSKRFVKE